MPSVQAHSRRVALVLFAACLALLCTPQGAGAATLSATFAQTGDQTLTVSAGVTGAPKRSRVVFETKRFSSRSTGKAITRLRKVPRSGVLSQKLRLPKGTRSVTARVRLVTVRQRKGKLRQRTVRKSRWQTIKLSRGLRTPAVADVAPKQVQAVVAPSAVAPGAIRIAGKTSALKPGRIIGLGITPQTPEGLLARITSVTRDGAGATASLVPASITELAPAGSLDVDLPIEPLAARAAKTGGQRDFGLQCEGSRSATASVSTELSAGVRLSAKWTGVNLWRGKTGHLKADLTGSVRAKLDGRLALDGEAECTLPTQGLFPTPVRLGVVTVPVGPVPVPIVIDGQINVSGSAKANGSIATAVNADASATAGVTYERGVFTPHKSFDKAFSHTPPAVNGTGSAQVALSPTIGVKIAGRAGTEIDLSSGLKLTGDLNPPPGQPWWRLTAPVSLGAKFSIDAWIINAESERMTLWAEEPLIAQADPATRPPGSSIIDQGPSPDPLPRGVKTRLVWDSDTDVDLHTWDQYGSHAYFSDLDAIPTGYLDRDVIPGYGPETFLETDVDSATEYTFGVCQYSGQNANVTVDVRDSDGQTRRFTVVLRGRKAAALLTTSPAGVQPYIDSEARWCSNGNDPLGIGQVTTGTFE